jgi:hypothetical protein
MNWTYVEYTNPLEQSQHNTLAFLEQAQEQSLVQNWSEGNRGLASPA